MQIEREAWLCGALDGVSPVLMPAAHALMQAAADIERAASNLSVAEIWTTPNRTVSILSVSGEHHARRCGGYRCLARAGNVDLRQGVDGNSNVEKKLR